MGFVSMLLGWFDYVSILSMEVMVLRINSILAIMTWGYIVWCVGGWLRGCVCHHIR